MRTLAGLFQSEEARIEQNYHNDIASSWAKQGKYVAEVEADFAKDSTAAQAKWASLRSNANQGTQEGQDLLGAGQPDASEMRVAETNIVKAASTDMHARLVLVRAQNSLLPKAPHGLPFSKRQKVTLDEVSEADKVMKVEGEG